MTICSICGSGATYTRAIETIKKISYYGDKIIVPVIFATRCRQHLSNKSEDIK